MRPDRNRKTKIALIPDEENWAFGNIARQIKKNLSDCFEFKIVVFDGSPRKLNQFYPQIEDCDILHFFWRDSVNLVLPAHCARNHKLKNKIISTAVYDHLLLSEEEIPAQRNLFNQVSYYVCSEKLYRIYCGIDLYKKPAMIIEDGVDPELFYPINIERLKDKEKSPLVIGWAGNSQWEMPYDHKGLETLIRPAVDSLRKAGYPVEGLYRDRSEGFTPHDQMVNYYSKIDILACMSETEGTPNPVLEAMACGLPVISTDVGIVPQAFGPRQKEFILKERSVGSLSEAILKLHENRELLWELSEENLRQIKNWHWPKQCRKFKAYFEML